MDFTGTERFRVVRRLGEGGMGIVYEAIDLERNARVALKTLTTLSPEGLLRFKNEFRALQDLDHPNLISLGELLEDRGRWFFTMELVEGPDFLSYVRHGDVGARNDAVTRQLAPRRVTGDDPTVAARGTPGGFIERRTAASGFDEERLRPALAGLARGLQALHTAGMVHRDVKPSNSMVTSEGRVVVLDFGLIADSDTAPVFDFGQVVGTIAYMAPEQASTRRVGPAADWYSVGVVLYEALTATLPFTGSTIEVLTRKQTVKPTPPSHLVEGVPKDLDELCLALLDVEPEARPDGAAILARLGIEDVPAPRSPRARRRPQTEPPFVGRTAELGVLREAFDESQRQRGVSVVVSGESGVGKSTLVARFLDEVRAKHANAVILTGRCYEREAVPYKGVDGVVDALSEWMVTLPTPEAAAYLPRRAALLTQVFPVLERIEAVSLAPKYLDSEVPRDPRELRARVFSAMRELLGKIAAHRPLVISIDDVQWSDADSVVLLSEVLRPPDAPGMLLVVTFRGTTAISLPGDVRDLVARRLGRDEAQKLARLLLPSNVEWAARSAERIAAEADGHPLFIDELIRHTSDSGSRDAETLHLDDALWRRVEQLAEPARNLLEVVSIAGAPLRQDVAAAASGQSPGDFAALAIKLRTANMVRASGARGADVIEPYHDRVRQAVASRLPEARRKERHEKLAIVLEASHGDAESLAFHWREAGDTVKASRYALDAAKQAASTLAFERAAGHWRLALELAPDRSDEALRPLRMGLAEALANAGRGGDAAEAYLAAAAGAKGPLALDLRRNAVEYLLRSGRLERGLALLEEVAADARVPVARTQSAAIRSIVLQRLALAVRGRKYKERDAADIPAEELARIDVCWSASAGLALVDAVRANPFHLRSLRLGLAAGEPYRLSRALAMEAMQIAARDAASPRVEELLVDADRLAKKSGNPHGNAFVVLGRGVQKFYRGEWRGAVELVDAADLMFREACTGLAAGSPASRLYAIWGLLQLGDLREVALRLPELSRTARERGDLQAVVNFSCSAAHFVHLADERVAEAKDEVEHALDGYPDLGLTYQHFMNLVARAEIDLYEGEAKRADERLAARWKELRRSPLLRTQKICVDAHWARARGIIAAGGSPRTLAKIAETIATRGADWARPLATATRGAAAALGGDKAAGAKLFGEAARAFDEGAMALHAVVARRRQGELSAQRKLVEDADAWLRDQGVTAPEAYAEMISPRVGR